MQILSPVSARDSVDLIRKQVPNTQQAIASHLAGSFLILRSDDYDLWLDPGMKNVDAASELLKPYDASLMRCYPVSIRINHVANDDDCSRPVELAGIQNLEVRVIGKNRSTLDEDGTIQ